MSRTAPIAALTLAAALALRAPAHGGASSGFPSEVDGFPIPNAHEIEEGRIYRGGEPRSQVKDVVKFGITDVLIFKTQNLVEVSREIHALKELGIDEANIRHIPYRWKDLPDFQQPCEQTVEALRILTELPADPKRKLFYHCTHGEDRTGLLSGLYRILDDGWELRKSFHDEMCENGYEAGNPKKGGGSVAAIRQSLTPLFLKMAWLIETGKLSKGDLNAGACRADPAESKEFQQSAYAHPEDFLCKKSSKFPKN